MGAGSGGWQWGDAQGRPAPHVYGRPEPKNAPNWIIFGAMDSQRCRATSYAMEGDITKKKSEVPSMIRGKDIIIRTFFHTHPPAPYAIVRTCAMPHLSTGF